MKENLHLPIAAAINIQAGAKLCLSACYLMSIYLLDSKYKIGDFDSE